MWSGERVSWDESACGNPVIPYPFKKRPNIELFIEWRDFYLEQTQIRVWTNEGGQLVGAS